MREINYGKSNSCEQSLYRTITFPKPILFNDFCIVDSRYIWRLKLTSDDQIRYHRWRHLEKKLFQYFELGIQLHIRTVKSKFQFILNIMVFSFKFLALIWLKKLFIILRIAVISLKLFTTLLRISFVFSASSVVLDPAKHIRINIEYCIRNQLPFVIRILSML